MAIYPTSQIVNGLLINTYWCNPVDGSLDLTYPVYLNYLNASGLVQPFGPVGENGTYVISGIVSPVDGKPYQVYQFFRPAPSGLELTFNNQIYADEFLQPSGVQGYPNLSNVPTIASGVPTGPRPKVTYWYPVNEYTPHWYATSTKSFFIQPAIATSGMPPDVFSRPVNTSVPANVPVSSGAQIMC